MKNFIQAGSNLTLTAPYAVTSGAGCKIGSIFGVACGDAANGATVDLATFGVFDLVKVSTDAFTVGSAVYWNDTTKLCTSTASGNTKIGVAVVDAGNPSGSVKTRLNGTF